jgi:hypothetical protein
LKPKNFEDTKGLGMPTIIALEPSEQNPLAQFSAKASRTVKVNGRIWSEHTYELYRFPLCQRILLGCLAFFATIALIPLAVCFAKVKKLWQNACCTTQKIVRIANEKLTPTPVKNHISTTPQFTEVTQEEILRLQPDLKETFFARHSIPVDEWPRYKLQLDGITYYCSNPVYNENIVRPAIIALVCKDGHVYPRVFYSSNSQACWRVAPLIEYQPFYIGKGKDENDTQLPIAVQIALNRLPTNPKKSSVLLHHITGQNEDNYCQEVESIALSEFPGLLPNFGNPILVTEINASKYGKLKASLFASKDGSVQYLFYEDKNGRAFLAVVEKVKDNPINSYGVRKNAFELLGMDAPLIEHACMISKEFWAEAEWEPKYPEGRYSSNWNYVRQIKIIQDYYRAQKREAPPEIRNLPPFTDTIKIIMPSPTLRSA